MSRFLDPPVLITDGGSDRCLLFPLAWMLDQLGWQGPMVEWADLSWMSATRSWSSPDPEGRG